VRQGPNGEAIRDAFTLRAEWAVTAVDESKSANREMFFTLEDLGGLTGIARWLAVAELHRSTLDRMMATHYARKAYVADRYLNRLVSLEAFDRQEHGTAGYKTVLQRCVALAGKPITDLVPDHDKWTTRLKNDRNALAHHLSQLSRRASSDQLFLSDSAYWLYVICLLRKANAPERVFERIGQNQQFLFLMRRLAKLF